MFTIIHYIIDYKIVFFFAFFLSFVSLGVLDKGSLNNVSPDGPAVWLAIANIHMSEELYYTGWPNRQTSSRSKNELASQITSHMRVLERLETGGVAGCIYNYTAINSVSQNVTLFCFQKEVESCFSWKYAANFLNEKKLGRGGE